MRGTPGTQLIHIFLRCWLTLNKFQIPKVSIKSQPCLGNRAHSHTAAETRGGMVATPGVRPSGHLEGPVEQGRTCPVPSCRTSQRYPAPCLGKHLTQAPSHDTAQSWPWLWPRPPQALLLIPQLLSTAARSCFQASGGCRPGPCLLPSTWLRPPSLRKEPGRAGQ